MGGDVRADLVLVGAGHAHVQVLRRWMMAPMAGVRLSLVVDRPTAVYSGMVPGFVAGEYAAHELEIDAVPLARRARARVVLAAATGIDPVRRRIHVAGRSPVAYDVASLDVGSSVRGLELAGVREHALATRPISGLVDDLEARLARLPSAEPRLMVVGGGAAGLELAFTLQARLRAAGQRPEVTLVDGGDRVMPGYPRAVARRAEREAERRGIRLRSGARVDAVHEDALELDGEMLGCDLVVWATGAAPHAFLAKSSLPLDAQGFVRVRPTLQVEGHDDLFAVGDCASLEAPWVRKAGVYAVRQGPVVDANLRARLRGRRLRSYRPQRDFLALLNLGDGRALGAKWGVPFVGRPVWRWKDRIDRRFMRRFQTLAPDGTEAADFPSRASMGMEEMACGGCAAKVGGSPLEAALSRLPAAPEDPSVAVGLAQPDDAAALRMPSGDVVLASVDAFRAFSDDPWLVGRVAAVNAASDVLAKGGRPRHAMALVTVPELDPARAEETLYQVLAGVRVALDSLGVSLVGGHSTQGAELFVGLSISGDLEDGAAHLGLGGLRPGDALILSKPVGTGVALAADMVGLLPGRQLPAIHASLVRSNADAARIARAAGTGACTDVSGFGLAGHLGEMLRASGVAAVLALECIPVLDGVVGLLARGLRSTFHDQNVRGRQGLAIDADAAEEPALELLFDPQTSGGLLFGVEPGAADATLDALRAAGDERAAIVGLVTHARADGRLIRVARDTAALLDVEDEAP